MGEVAQMKAAARASSLWHKATGKRRVQQLARLRAEMDETAAMIEEIGHLCDVERGCTNPGKKTGEGRRCADHWPKVVS